MKRIALIFSLILCLGSLLCACNKDDDTGTVGTSQLTQALALYTKAQTAIQNASDLQVTSQLSRQRAVGPDVYSETASSQASYRHGSDGTFLAHVAQNLTYGTFQMEYAEYHTGGNAYSTASGITFQGDLSSEEFLDRQIPALLIDPDLYGTAEVKAEDGLTILTFTAPTALEAWVTDISGAVPSSAAGTVTIGADGNLLRSTYEATYLCGTATYTLSVTSAPTLGLDAKLSERIPAPCDTCVALEYFDTPKRILQVVGDVYTSQSITASYTSRLYSEFAPVVRTQNSQYDIFGSGAELLAKTQHDVTVIDYSNTPQQTTETGLYSGGILTTTVNGGDPRNTSISPEQIRISYEDALLSPVFMLNYLASAQATMDGHILQIQFSGNDTFAQNLCDGIYATFLKTNLDQYYSFTNDLAEGYLYIDRYTCLPVAMGYNMQRTHQFGAVPYVLQYQMDQTITLSSDAAHGNIVN